MTDLPAGVSFVIPVYNKAEWLPGVIAALKSQRGDFAREYIFVDDGSTDGSLEIVRRETAGWPNVTILSQANAGSAAASNAGIMRARYAFTKFCDADDMLLPDATARLLAAIRAHPGVCLAWGGRVWYASAAEAAAYIEPPLDPATVLHRAPLKPAMQNSLFNPAQFMARTADLKACGGCDERIVFSQEYSLTLRMALRGDFVQIAAPVALVLRDAPGRLSGNTGRQLQRVTLALAWFLRDHPELAEDDVRFACRRAAGRAWKWRRRQYRAGFLSPWFGRYLRARLPGLPLPADPAGFIDACAAAFAQEGSALPGAAAAKRQQGAG